MTVWTYTRIDYDLLRDDLESAGDIAPGVAWTTPELAKLAAEADWQDEDEDGGNPPLAWEEERGRREGEVSWVSVQDEIVEFRVYSVRVDSELREKSR